MLLVVGWSAPGARADPPPPARPPGRATLGWWVGPRTGGTGLRGVDVFVELVLDPSLVLGFRPLTGGVLLLAHHGLGLVVGGVGPLDGLLELAQRRVPSRSSPISCALA